MSLEHLSERAQGELASALGAERGVVLVVGARGPLEEACGACAAALAAQGRAVTWVTDQEAPAGARRVRLDPARGVFPAEAIAEACASEGAVVALLVDRTSAELARRAGEGRLFVAGLYGVELGEARARLEELAGEPVPLRAAVLL